MFTLNNKIIFIDVIPSNISLKFKTNNIRSLNQLFT